MGFAIPNTLTKIAVDLADDGDTKSWGPGEICCHSDSSESVCLYEELAIIIIIMMIIIIKNIRQETIGSAR